MTATVAFAGAGGVPGSSHSAWNRDQTGASPAPDESESPEASEAADESEAPESADVNDAATANHGALVSTAAGMDTPDGFANHGAFVSCVAHMDHDVDPATFDWATVTPESCGYVTDASGTDQSSVNGHGHGWGRTKAKHHGANPN
jgi:hypothetical protein